MLYQVEFTRGEEVFAVTVDAPAWRPSKSFGWPVLPDGLKEWADTYARSCGVERFTVAEYAPVVIRKGKVYSDAVSFDLQVSVVV